MSILAQRLREAQARDHAVAAEEEEDEDDDAPYNSADEAMEVTHEEALEEEAEVMRREMLLQKEHEAKSKSRSRSPDVRRGVLDALANHPAFGAGGGGGAGVWAAAGAGAGYTDPVTRGWDQLAQQEREPVADKEYCALCRFRGGDIAPVEGDIVNRLCSWMRDQVHQVRAPQLAAQAQEIFNERIRPFIVEPEYRNKPMALRQFLEHLWNHEQTPRMQVERQYVETREMGEWLAPFRTKDDGRPDVGVLDKWIKIKQHEHKLQTSLNRHRKT